VPRSSTFNVEPADLCAHRDYRGREIEAARRVLVDLGQVLGSYFRQLSEEMRAITPEEIARLNDMLADLNELLGHHASLARRRGARELPVKDGPLLLDSAYPVDRSQARRFRTTLAREARRLEPEGYRVSLTGPWPPYSFLE